MILQHIDGLVDVIATGNKVFVHVDDWFDAAQLQLVTKHGDLAFSPIDLSLSTRYELKERQNTQVALKPLGVDRINQRPQVMVNALNDWHVPGYDTLQIEFSKDSPPHRLTFPRKIMIRNAKDRTWLRARLASHRAFASLIATVRDLDRQTTETHSLKFDLSCIGGRAMTGYQDVELALPDGLRNAEIEVAIDYLGCSDKTCAAPPYLFLFDVHACEGDSETDFPEELFKTVDTDGRWFCVETKLDLDGLDHAGLRLGNLETVLLTPPVINARAFFDEAWYEKQFEVAEFDDCDAWSHYLLKGWRERKNPNSELNVREYLLRNPDVEAAGTEPLIHYANLGQREGRSIGGFGSVTNELWRRTGAEIPGLDAAAVFRRAQDLLVPMELLNTRKLVVFVVPEHNAMSGGIYSIFSIAEHVRRSKRRHGYDVIVMTRSNPQNETYLRNTAFRNSETVFNLEQLRLFANVSDLQLHIPEYATVEFVRYLSQDLLNYVTSRDTVHINILNQNTRLMPEADRFRDLRRIADTIGQSVSHHAYFGQKFADYYNLPSLLLPAYTDLTPYPPSRFEEKQNLIIYSDDKANYRGPVMRQLARLKDYKLVKICDMTFDRYMEYATNCRFSVSFGEGFDGYVAQPIYQGGIGLALYTDEFFPDDSYCQFDNFFSSEEEMIEQIVPTIRRLEADQAAYEELNRQLRAKWDELYDYDDYVARIGQLIAKDYEIFPAS